MRWERGSAWLGGAVAALVLATLGCSQGSNGARAQAGPTPIPVEATTPARSSVERRLGTTADLEPWEEVVLYAKVSGYLKSIAVDRGDRVRRGQVLAVLDIPEMADEYERQRALKKQSEAEVEKDRADVELHEQVVRRLVAIRAEEAAAASEQELDLASAKLKAARASLAADEARVEAVQAEIRRLDTLIGYERLTAPFDGIVTDRYVDTGALVTAATQSKPSPIVKVVDSSTLRAMVDIPETEVAHLTEGRIASLRVDAFPDRVFDGKVTRFSRALDPRSRTMRTEIAIANANGALAAGMFGRLNLDLETRENVLTLPPACIHLQK